MFIFVLIGASASATATARPPNQTKVQYDTWYHWASNAAALSNAAKPNIMKILDSAAFRKEISSLPISSNSSDTLLKMLEAEMSYADSIHNVPYHTFLETMTRAQGNNRSLSGVPFNVVDNLKFLPTIWEELALNITAWNPAAFVNYNKVQVGLMKYPDFPKLPPTLPAAYDRPLYSSLNIWKKSAGNLEFGNVALVFDRTGQGDKKIFLSPVDTGCYVGKCGTYLEGNANDTTAHVDAHTNLGGGSGLPCGGIFGKCDIWDKQFGTMQYFLHVVIPHLSWWRCSLGSLYMRWYANAPVCVDAQHEVGSYFEGLISGAFLIPEDLLYVIVKYDDFFARPDGKNMQAWAEKLKRPLAYANDDHTGTVLDATVGGLTGSYIITQHDKDALNALWTTPRVSWDAFHKNITYSLHITFRGYDSLVGKYCDPSKYVGAHFLGYNHYRACLYFK